ncbi:MAG: hypothetical protein KGH94_01455 [Candidatus Micrarchaeota archaeon]|nr:hypothetical protein [Candidatus Micrarchaeota archaeon]
MNVNSCVKAAGSALKSYRPLICEFCGAETLSGGGMAFCSNCESIVESESKTLEGTNPSLFGALASIRTAIARSDFDAAGVGYDGLLVMKQTPGLLYAKGIMSISHSNHVVSQIRYDGDGFMEGNSELRAKGSLILSEAKRLIAKSRAMSEKEAMGVQSPRLLYNLFLCDLKVGDLRAASDRLAGITGLEKDGALAIYSAIVLDTFAGRHHEAERSLERIFGLESPPANSFYYAAFNSFKLGDRAGASKILSSSGSLIEDSKRENLLSAMKLEDSQ